MRAGLVAILSLALAGPCVFGASVSGEDGTLAFVNVEEVFDRYEKTREINAKMERERKEKISERKTLVEEINKLKDEADILRDEAKSKKEEVVDKKVKELYQFEEKIKREALKRRARYQEQILEEVQETLLQIGKSGGYTAIIPFTEGEIGYHSPALDVTDEVVKNLNKKHKDNR